MSQHNPNYPVQPPSHVQLGYSLKHAQQSFEEIRYSSHTTINLAPTEYRSAVQTSTTVASAAISTYKFQSWVHYTHQSVDINYEQYFDPQNMGGGDIDLIGSTEPTVSHWNDETDDTAVAIVNTVQVSPTGHKQKLEKKKTFKSARVNTVKQIYTSSPVKDEILGRNKYKAVEDKRPRTNNTHA